jgi:DNA-binding SARP family transcriptional activator
MEVRLLGPLELADGGRSIAYGGARQRAVLALLVLHANQVVASERVLVELWGEDAPPGAANALQAAVSRLRRALPEGRLVTRPPGYLFRAVPDEVDVSRFERLLAQGRQALADGAAAEAADLLAEALALWRGPVLAEFRYEPCAQARSPGWRSCGWSAWRSGSRPTWPSAPGPSWSASSRAWSPPSRCASGSAAS